MFLLHMHNFEHTAPVAFPLVLNFDSFCLFLVFFFYPHSFVRSLVGRVNICAIVLYVKISHINVSAVAHRNVPTS